ncbi:hypothetical protein HYH03_010278 [Edaphochlamys debaryana]|uniref:PCI domain-containing protein n=1 Tax=Edaphochlamys debaryana TaxID=47281 RepID=A0A835XZG9_9CHLO|nr:hypothetical protein HYH03_010278 [Edaphochlamys debaryana]|eukprot:KAG2491271.1 hypothetical protein HYH03_010278 [Edaphochlamys debaryana]
MAAQVGSVYAKMTDKEAECCVSIMVHAVGRVPEARQQAAAASTLAAALAKGDEKPEERMSALLSLFAMVAANAPAQLAVLLAAAGFAAASTSPKCRATFCASVRGKAARWAAEWKLSPTESRRLFLALAAPMRGAPDRPTTREHLALVGSALALTGAGDDRSPEVVEAAAAALADYLRSAAVLTLDLLPLPGVAGLASHAKYGPLHKLVAAVLAGDVSAARAAAVPAALEACGAGLTADGVLSKARMTALLSKCAAAGHGEVALSELKAALDVPEDQVAPWVVRAIGAKLLEGRLDSVRGTLTVGRSTHPAFGQAQWTKLGSQLAALKETVAAAAGAMASVRPPPQVSARGVAQAAAARVAA